MTVGGDPPDDVAVARGHPAEDEEGRMNSPPGEQPQQAIDRLFDPRVAAAPARLVDPKVVRVEPALHVDREQRGAGGAHCSCSERSGAGLTAGATGGRHRPIR